MYFPPTGVHRNVYLVKVNLRLEISDPFILLGQHGFIGSDGATQPCYQVQKLHVGLLKVRLTSGQNATQSSLGLIENSGGEAIESSWVQLVTPVSTFYQQLTWVRESLSVGAHCRPHGSSIMDAYQLLVHGLYCRCAMTVRRRLLLPRSSSWAQLSIHNLQSTLIGENSTVLQTQCTSTYH